MSNEQKKQRTWLWHDDHPAKIFDITEDEQEELIANGWVDTPAKLKKEQVEIKKPVDNTPAELSKEAEALLQSFLVDPTKLDKEKLIELAKAFDVRATRNMGDATIIKAIQEFLNGDGQKTD